MDEYTGALEPGCDAALLIGMHAKAGTPDGVLSHTVSRATGRTCGSTACSVGETGINAALCGHFGTPFVLVSGDRATCEEARALLGDGLAVVDTSAAWAATRPACSRRRWCASASSTPSTRR